MITRCRFGMHSLAFHGGSNNSNVLDRNPLVRNLLTGHANGVGFWVNKNGYNKYYLLANKTYSKWSCFV